MQIDTLLTERLTQDEQSEAEAQRITQFPVKTTGQNELCFHNGWMYYINMEGRYYDYKVYRTPISPGGDLDYSKTERVTKRRVYSMRLAEGWLYLNNGYSFCRIQLDGNRKIETIVSRPKGKHTEYSLGHDFDVDGEWLYYNKKAKDKFSLCRVNISGNDKMTLTKALPYDNYCEPQPLASGDGKVYFVHRRNKESPGMLVTAFSVCVDGSGLQELSEESPFSTFGRIFYLDTLYALSSDSHGLYRWNDIRWERIASIPGGAHISDDRRFFWSGSEYGNYEWKPEHKDNVWWVSEFGGSNRRMFYSQAESMNFVTAYEGYAYFHEGSPYNWDEGSPSPNAKYFRVHIESGQREDLKLNTTNPKS